MAAVGRLTMLGLYKAVTTEMDKTNSASFTLTQFNYYANREQLNLLTDLVDIFETTQVLSDLLSPFVARKNYTATTTPPIIAGQVMAQPDDYHQALKATCTFTVQANFSGYRAGQSFTRSPKRLTSDMQAYIEEPNHYLKPTFDRTYRRVVAGQLEIYSGIHSRLTLSRVYFEYIRLPEEMELLETDLLDPTIDPSQVLEWTVPATYELARYITKALLEKSGNQRLQNYAALNQPNVGLPGQQTPPQQAAQAAQQAAQPQQQ